MSTTKSDFYRVEHNIARVVAG
ncbi:hypothetical protein CY0110_18107 [Crocosphaera chwakensis CCY0110]|uniref:Uncharacterized protein n=1 Tax=Crocosphaera chwakensis CCY0110 TaxID=391612 RepID=A3IIV3_9CHRO|nr:hypothetical protein CY0110_18107 [Crocosphaera chwakensis CCY0110]